MSEKSTPMPIEQAYAQLKELLLKNKCKITEEKPPTYISVKQGSLSGILPKSAKKIVQYYLYPEGAGTKIRSSTKIASDWTNLTLYGNILAAVLVVILFWVAVDIENYMLTARPSFWTWLARANLDPQHTMVIVNVTKATAICLALTIAVEILIVIYVYPRKNEFTQEILKGL